MRALALPWLLVASVAGCGGEAAGPPDADVTTPDAPSTADAAPPDAPPPPADKLVTVEQSSGRVLVLPVGAGADWSDDAAIVWSWHPADSPEIDPAHHGWFGNPSDVKWRAGGETVLVAASGGGAAIVRTADRRTTFYVRAGGNPHAVELLPDGNLVVASSEGAFVRVYVTDPSAGTFPGDVPSVQAILGSAHGLHWDEARQRLFAVGWDEVVAYRYGGTATAPTLEEVEAWPLPSIGGHDLSPVGRTGRLYVTTHDRVHELDPDTGAFTPPAVAPDEGGIKGIDEEPTSGRIAVVRATESWWSDTVRLVGPAATHTRAGARFYKARWWVPGR